MYKFLLHSLFQASSWMWMKISRDSVLNNSRVNTFSGLCLVSSSQILTNSSYKKKGYFGTYWNIWIIVYGCRSHILWSSWDYDRLILTQRTRRPIIICSRPTVVSCWTWQRRIHPLRGTGLAIWACITDRCTLRIKLEVKDCGIGHVSQIAAHWEIKLEVKDCGIEGAFLF